MIMMQIFSERLKALREGVRMSQATIAALVGTTQSSINRYEKQVGLPPHETLLWYADYFDVSMDYIYGRTDKPQGRLYDYQPKAIEDNEEMRQFIEMCFDPKSPMNDRLKKMLLQMMKGGIDNER
jgi:transcriptional regulator with XRE-family HTH domain